MIEKCEELCTLDDLAVESGRCLLCENEHENGMLKESRKKVLSRKRKMEEEKRQTDLFRMVCNLIDKGMVDVDDDEIDIGSWMKFAETGESSKKNEEDEVDMKKDPDFVSGTPQKKEVI